MKFSFGFSRIKGVGNILFRKGGVEMEAKTGISLVQEWGDFNKMIKTEELIQPVKVSLWQKRGCPYFLSVEDLSQRQLFNHKLIKLAQPYMDQLSLNFYRKPHLVVLTDGEGWVIAKRNRGVGFFDQARICDLGASWSNHSFGTNGVGSVLDTGEASLVYGIKSEDSLQDLVVIGVPIRSLGKVIGVLGILAVEEDALPLRLSFALTAVDYLEDAYNSVLALHRKMLKMEKFLSMGSILANTIHDVKNPLANIRAISQLGLLSNKCVKQRDYFQRIIDNIDQLNEMLNTLMSNFRSEELTFASPVVVIEEVIAQISSTCQQQQITVELNFEAKPSTMLSLGLFKRVMENLLKNAIHAMPDGGRLCINVSTNLGYILIAVKDTGPGIPSHIQKNIFEPLVHSKEDKVGLGLCLAYYAITEVHNGRLWFETDPEQGTIFYLQLPIKENFTYQ